MPRCLRCDGPLGEPVELCRDCRAITAQPSRLACPVCAKEFEAHRPNQVYCSPECRERQRGRRYIASGLSTEERGYGRKHQAERQVWAERLALEGSLPCTLCPAPVLPGDDWHLDHTPDRTGYRGVAHSRCNTSDGARRGAAHSNQPTVKSCATCEARFATVYPRQRYCSRGCRPKRERSAPTPRPVPQCVDCGVAVEAGKRCAPCWRNRERQVRAKGRTASRNRYRDKVGIPRDAPLSPNGRPRRLDL